MELAVVGAGYVGLVAAACFAETGNDVVCVDIDERRVERLRAGEIPIYEPGLDDIVKRNLREGRLSFSTNLKDAIERSGVIFIAVGTPPGEDGSADLRHVLDVARGIGTHMNGPKVVVDKSTVPVGTARLVEQTIRERTKHHVSVVSNPEFLKEGAAVDDFMRPDRVVIGTSDQNAAQIMQELYGPFVRTNNPILLMDVASAEMTKYAANAMLATRVSFMNEISRLCERVGADIDQVRLGIGTDSRIGMSFLFPGIGYGGSCFPKDVQALLRTGTGLGVDLPISQAVEEVNAEQKKVLVRKVDQVFADGIEDRTIAVWGLSFKPRTDDVREAPSLVICRDLIDRGARLQAYDPEAIESFSRTFGESNRIIYTASNYEALKGADALVICTEWNAFRRPNFQRMRDLMRSPVIFDGRNIFSLTEMREEGFTYYSIGRPPVRPEDTKC